jgi:hypothetical protein
METARYQPSSAEEFWGGMIMDDGLKANDPRKVLLRYLNNKPANAARDDTKKATALAWNAFFVDRPLELLRPNQLKVFRIEGTPYGDEKRERENARHSKGVNIRRGKSVEGPRVSSP